MTLNLDFFKEKIKEKFGTQDAFAEALQVSRQTVSSWVNERSPILENKLFLILNLLNLNEDEEETLLNTPKTQLYFRSTYSLTPREENRKVFQELADTFMIANSTMPIHSKTIIRGLESESVPQITSYLRSLFTLPDGVPIKFDFALAKLKELNVNVVFFPFSKIGVKVQSQSKEVAFTAIKADSILVVLDTERRFDEVLFDLMHELTHIICNHDPLKITKDQENFCNKVAQEMIYPRAFFKLENTVTERFTCVKKQPYQEMKNVFDKIEEVLDWSPKGLALALKDYSYLKYDSQEFKILMHIHANNFVKYRQSFDSAFFKNFDTNNYDKLVIFFNEDIYKSKDIYKGILELKNAASSGQISKRRFAEVFSLNFGDADELVKSWSIEGCELAEGLQSVPESEL